LIWFNWVAGLHSQKKIAAVVIGRNEGERLVRCLKSLQTSISTIVYVDSGSSDNSLEIAKTLSVEAIALDLSVPFTAARARNTGASHLVKNNPELDCIQFIDGDCELQPNWINKAVAFLENNPQYAAVCGRRRERYPDKSIYNQLCDIEWNTSIGDTDSCGGDVLIKAVSFKLAGGFNSGLIAGEEPEMCFRLRQLNWKIQRLDEEMTLHDAAMYRFSQWWNRAKRAGYAYGATCYLHRNDPGQFRVKEVKSILFWALLIPITIIFLSFYKIGFCGLIGLYLFQIIRVAKKTYGKTGKDAKSIYYSVSVVFAKFPQLLGILKLAFNKLFNAKERLIEYK
jgi:glycosyltransferase involved in cell wall biosynthesis